MLRLEHFQNVSFDITASTVFIFEPPISGVTCLFPTPKAWLPVICQVVWWKTFSPSNSSHFTFPLYLICIWRWWFPFTEQSRFRSFFVIIRVCGFSLFSLQMRLSRSGIWRLRVLRPRPHRMPCPLCSAILQSAPRWASFSCSSLCLSLRWPSIEASLAACLISVSHRLLKRSNRPIHPGIVT